MFGTKSEETSSLAESQMIKPEGEEQELDLHNMKT
jgi:hypothetical protein